MWSLTNRWVYGGNLDLLRGGVSERLELENTSLKTQAVELALEAMADFADLFEARGWHKVSREIKGFEYTAQDGLRVATQLILNPPPAAQYLATKDVHPRVGETFRWEYELPPQAKKSLLKVGVCSELRATQSVDNRSPKR